MAVWMVRAGAHGEQEDLALEKSMAVIGWSELPDLSTCKSRDEVYAAVAEARPDDKRNSLLNQAGQLWAFMFRIQPGDLVVIPLKTRAAVAIGEVTGGYVYRPDMPDGAHHTRALKWLRQDVPRSAFGQDLLYSLGAFMTVCQIRRNNAEGRIAAVAASGRDPGVSTPIPGTEEGEEPPIDIEEYARDQIRAHIGQRLKGHNLTRLVVALLQAHGYQTYMAPEGPDGGVDIVAGKGPMGFDPPKLCVQVKSSEGPIDVKIFRELQGVMHDFGADQALLVSFGGFKASVYQEARKKFFQIRLWDAGDLVDNLTAYYDKLPADFQAELPLKRIWTLVPQE
jgi:restriction system protein